MVILRCYHEDITISFYYLRDSDLVQKRALEVCSLTSDRLSVVSALLSSRRSQDVSRTWEYTSDPFVVQLPLLNYVFIFIKSASFRLSLSQQLRISLYPLDTKRVRSTVNENDRWLTSTGAYYQPPHVHNHCRRWGSKRGCRSTTGSLRPVVQPSR